MRIWTCFATSWAYLPGTYALPSEGLVRRDAPYEEVRDHPGWSHQNKDEDEPDKYFHESSFSEHYDGRFADKPLLYDERRDHLVTLMQTYSASMDDIGAETWIMHGTLLGHYWNRKILPWDSDLDVMVTERSLQHMADFYNMTVHHHKMPGVVNGFGLDVYRDYLLEVNPHYANASLDAVNKIDARWIDTETGLFIDITTLHRNRTEQGEDKADAMVVKDKHYYDYDDIFPLRESTFEGFPVKVPFAHIDLLIEEYGEKALAEVYYLNHKFEAAEREWRPLRADELTEFQKHGPQLSTSY